MKNDFDKLRHWQALFRSGHVLVEVANRALAKESLALVQKGFDTETDPYGKPWKAKKRPDGRMILRGKTSRLRTGWRARAYQKRFILWPSVDYAAAHQDSQRRQLTRRMMVPSKRRGMPKLWRAAYTRVVFHAVQQHFRTK